MENTNFFIRPATTDDAAQLRHFSIATFTDTYATYNTPENMQLYVDTYFNMGQIITELADPAMQYFLAFTNNALCGYIKLRTVDNPPGLDGVKHIEIERIYVLPAYKGMQVGKKLINHAADIAKQQAYETIWLGVWEKNENAIAFYKKMGFNIFGEHIFVLGTDEQKDWLMKKDIAQ